MGLVSGLVGFWAGFRSNLWIARRAEWNAVVDRIRDGLLNSQRLRGRELRISTADIDMLTKLASWRLRRQISTVLDRHARIAKDYQRGSMGQTQHTPEQDAEMRQLRERLLEIVQRR